MSAQRRSPRAWLLCAAALAACADLPKIETNICGNGVIETGEDCDGFSVYSDAKCREPGKVGACHLDCSPDEQGVPTACPQGWGCDATAICRAPSGNFSVLPSHNVGAIAGLLAGDFDGDRRSEIVSRAPLDRLMQSRLAFHYFDQQGDLEETLEFAKPVSPWLGQLSDDARVDLVFSDGSLGLMLGREDRRIVLETFSSYRVPDAMTRALGVYDDLIDGSLNLLSLTNYGGESSLNVPDIAQNRLRNVGALADPIEPGTAPASGDIIEGRASSPCDEAVLAPPNTSTFWLIDACQPMRSDGVVEWRREAVQRPYALIPAAKLSGQVRIADLDNDGHLDVLLGIADDAGSAYVAHGDGTGLRDAVPFSLDYLDNRTPKADARLPLAVGDFSGDGWADFVYENHLVASTPVLAPGPPRYDVVAGNLGAPWTLAAVADVNGNAKNDVIVASDQAVGITVYNGTGSTYPLPTTFPTEQPVQFLRIGDFDGDLTNDIAFVERPVPDEQRASLSIAYGNVSRPPEPPKLVGRAQNPVQLSGYRLYARDNLVLVAEREEPEPFSDITTIEGAPDRIPFAPYMLVTFAEDGNFESHPALHVLGGSFRGPAHRDVIALDSNVFNFLSQSVNRFWLLTDLAEGKSTPLPLVDGKLDAMFRPEREDETGPLGALSRETLQIASCAVDLDGDQRDEAIWAIPNSDGACGIISFSVRDQGPTLLPRQELVLDQHCATPAVVSKDVNDDGAADLLLLGSDTDQPAQRALWVLWNDGQGSFAADRMSRISEGGEEPLAFTTLPAVTVPGEGTIAESIVYVTQRGLTRKIWSAERRRFESDAHLPALTVGAGSAITAGDFNGDGAVDLALGDGNKLVVLLAELEAAP